MVDPLFLPARGGGGGLWHLLPKNVDGVEAASWATHIVQVDAAGFGDGGPTFSLVQFDHATNKAVNLSASVPIDLGSGVRYASNSTRAKYLFWRTLCRHRSQPISAAVFGKPATARVLNICLANHPPQPPPSFANALHGAVLFHVLHCTALHCTARHGTAQNRTGCAVTSCYAQSLKVGKRESRFLLKRKFEMFKC
jgi:hypothetical protein